MSDQPPSTVIETESGRILSTMNWLRPACSAPMTTFSHGGDHLRRCRRLSEPRDDHARGIAAIAAGALSMAWRICVGSTQRDIERAELAREKRDLEEDPERELNLLARFSNSAGVEPALAKDVARQMTAKVGCRSTPAPNSASTPRQYHPWATPSPRSLDSRSASWCRSLPCSCRRSRRRFGSRGSRSW